MTDDKLNWYARVPELKLYDGSAPLTEEEWLSCPLSWVMMRHLYRNRNGRKRRLFAVACCRHISDFIPEPFFPLLDIADHYVDGRTTREQLRDAWECAGWMYAPDDVRMEMGETPPCEYDKLMTLAEEWAAYCVYRTLEEPENFDMATNWDSDVAQWVATMAAEAVNYLEESRKYEEAKTRAEWSYQAGMLREIYGNPFREVAISSCWQTEPILELAHTMYNTGHFEQMPQLGNALRALGCQDNSVLEHCDSNASHVRGCWLVDALINKI